MESFLPFLFIALSALSLLACISFMWASLRSLLGGEHQLYLEQSGAVRKRAELLDEKESILRSLKDLEFEREVGKLSDEDFKRLDGEFRQRAKAILRALDEDLRDHKQKAQALVQAELKKAANK